MPVYPGSPQLNIDVLLKQPEIISRSLTSLARKRFIADRILLQGSPESVRGGGAVFQKSESIYLDRDPEEVGVRAGFPRSGWSEAVFTALVHQYGLEVPIPDLTIRRHQQDQVGRALRKLANNIVRFVDTLAMTMITTDADVQTYAAAGDWTTAATDIIFDLVRALKQIAEQDEGYEDGEIVMVLNFAQWADLLNDKDIRDALPRENRSTQVQTGIVAPLLGMSDIIPTNRLAAGTVLILVREMIGTIADEAPDPSEGYSTYDPGDNKPVLSVKTFHEETPPQTVIRGARWPAMWIAEPKAAVKITGA